MHDAQKMVRDFHRAFDLPMAARPRVPDEKTGVLRARLLQEEFDELQEALRSQSLPHIAKELADLLYVAYGTAVAYGVDMEPVFREVQRSNMSKVGGHKRDDGKWVKPPTYSPARIEPILAKQRDAGSAEGALARLIGRAGNIFRRDKT